MLLSYLKPFTVFERYIGSASIATIKFKYYLQLIFLFLFSVMHMNRVKNDFEITWTTRTLHSKFKNLKYFNNYATRPVACCISEWQRHIGTERYAKFIFRVILPSTLLQRQLLALPCAKKLRKSRATVALLYRCRVAVTTTISFIT